LRHLGFSVTVRTAAGSSHGTITCDVVGVTEGNLLVAVTEDVTDRSSATKQVEVQSDGGLVYLPNQGTLNEEESQLVSLLAAGLLGADRAIGDTWTFKLTAPDYSANKTFRLADIKSQSNIVLNFDETFARTGSDPLTGTAAGSLTYDPTGLVPLRGKIDQTTRQGDGTNAKTHKVSVDFALLEDSRAPH
jgi:hypothetical protein